MFFFYIKINKNFLEEKIIFMLIKVINIFLVKNFNWKETFNTKHKNSAKMYKQINQHLRAIPFH